MRPLSRFAQCIVIICIIATPSYLIYSTAVTIENARIVDPMIGCPQFATLNGSFEIGVMTGGLYADHWNVSLISVDYSWVEPYFIEILDISGPLEGTYRLLVQIPTIIPQGLYDLSVSLRILGNEKTLVEPHSVYIYNATLLQDQLNFVNFGDPHVVVENRLIDVDIAPAHTSPNIVQMGTNDVLAWQLQEISLINPYFILILGDIATDGREPEFRMAREIITSSAKVPVLTTSGNHDYRSPPAYDHYLAPHYYSRSIAAWRIIVLDSGATEGNGLFGQQMEFYEHELQNAQTQHQQVMVGLHSPSSTIPMGGFTIAGNTQFRELNAKYGVRAIFAGHHHMFEANFANDTVVNIEDPITPAAGPIYVKTGSSSLQYGWEENKYIGFRYVSSYSNGDLIMGYDYYNKSYSDPSLGLPTNGLNFTRNGDELRIQNYYYKDFDNVTVSVEFSNTLPNDRYVPSMGRIVDQVYANNTLGCRVLMTIPRDSTITVKFTKITI